jgi:hypothetical protein
MPVGYRVSTPSKGVTIMRESTTRAAGPVRRFISRLRRETPHDQQSKSYLTPDGKFIVITCEGCGTPSEIELEHGHSVDNPAVNEGYFQRQCPHCGHELGTIATRQVI